MSGHRFNPRIYAAIARVRAKSDRVAAALDAADERLPSVRDAPAQRCRTTGAGRTDVCGYAAECRSRVRPDGARRACGMTQESLAVGAQLDRAYPSLLERGLRTPTLTSLFAISRALRQIWLALAVRASQLSARGRVERLWRIPFRRYL